jgi:pimeloyl-ACP methyl ester carboxylesterase
MDTELRPYESLRAGDIRFAYHGAGQGGLPIVLFHGWPQTSHAWRRMSPILSSQCDVVIPDLPGFGYTSKPDDGFDKKTISRRLRDFVRGLGLSLGLPIGLTRPICRQVGWRWAMTTGDARERIMAAARLTAQDRGYSGLSFRDLAKDVGIKSASIQHYFPTKGELGGALAERYRS